MLRFLGVRAIRLVIVLLAVTFAAMYLVDLAPGDPAVTIAGETATPEVVEAVRERYGYDEPLIVRWVNWIGDLIQGDLGTSHVSGEQVTTILAQRLPATLQLAVMAFVMSIVVVVPVALYAAYRKGSWVDRMANFLSSAVIAVPGFVIALLLILVFSLNLHWLPAGNWVPLTEDLAGNLKTAALPAATLAIGEIAILLPVLRADVLSTLEQDFILLARSKGISSWRILARHALRPSSISLVTLMGLALARAFGGTVIVETIFNLPGLGSRLVNSVRNQDLIVLQGLVIFLALVYVTANFIVDILYTKLDPRMVRE